MKIKILLLITLCLGLSACKKKKSELEVTLTTDSSYAINTATYTCSQLRIGLKADETGDVTGRRMIWGKPKFIWKNKEKSLIIDQMAVVFTSSVFGKYVYESFDPVEINAIILGSSSTATVAGYTSGTISPAPVTEGVNQVIQSNCELRAGGLKIRDASSSFRATGKLKVIGRSFTLNESSGEVQNEVPVYAETVLYIDYATF